MAEQKKDIVTLYVPAWNIRAMVEDECGLYVHFDDHMDAITRLTAENKRLREGLTKINAFVSGDARPNWSEDRDAGGVTATTRSRLHIGDICHFATLIPTPSAEVQG